MCLDGNGAMAEELLANRLIITVSGINSTDECFTARYSLHMRWVDRYYQLPQAPEGGGLFVQDGEAVSREQIVHYASNPLIGRRAVIFPHHDISVHGLRVRTPVLVHSSIRTRVKL